MADFLLVLAKINLAMSAAILMVALLRRPVRAAFHAPVAYALWLLVPAAALACLLPPRTVSIAAGPATGPVPQMTGQALEMPFAAQAAPFDGTLLLFAGWAAGAAAMLCAMAWSQWQFRKAEQRGEAGPAVAGFFRPRIVIPAGFAARYNAPEQAAVLAHEQAHLVRQDARVNACVALLRCLCWFNPVVHIGAGLLHRDQELACDAAALSHVSRIDYANALVKSQMRAVASPLGCAWPGHDHPLTERVALLKFAAPGPARRIAGICLVAALSISAGVGAWAAQPARPAHPSFTGKFFWAMSAFDKGPPLTMSLESGQDDKFNGPPKDKNNVEYKYVVMHFPYGFAQSDDAVMDFRLDTDMAQHKTITLKGNVYLATGGPEFPGAALKGETLAFDALTGMITMNGKSYPSGMPKYVPCIKNCKRIER